MKNQKQFKKTLIASALSIAISPLVALADMVELTDGEMANEMGQGLLSMAYTAPSGSGTGATYSDYGYYKLGLEAKMEINLNIRNLQLGCGGRNGPDNCDIDIENLSLSGPAESKIDNSAAIAPLQTKKNNGTITAAEQITLNDLIAANGQPTWSQKRPNTSAVLTNPFVEFAIKNPNTAATREIVGFRLSAEEILGHMSAGTVNDNVGGFSTGGGIKSFSGYIKVGETPVTSSTKQSIFGVTKDQAIAGNVVVLGNNKTAQTNVNKMTPGAPGYTAPDGSNTNVYRNNPSDPNSAIWGINVPTQTISFNFPMTAVTGNRMSQLNLVVRDVPVGSNIGGQPRIAIGRDSGAVSMIMSSAVLGLVDAATFFMGSNNAAGNLANCNATYSPADCSYITNLKANVTVKQNFNLVHNLPINGGGYLSLQKEALRWPGSAGAFTYRPSTGVYTNVADDYPATDAEVMNYGDIAQPGWWMSFKDPLDFGALNPTQQISMDDVLPQLATYITDFLSNHANNINVDAGAALGALFGSPLYKGLGDIKMAEDARAVMVLQNLQLDGHQNPVPNCWGGLSFC